MNFQSVVATLNEFWSAQGCIIAQPYDMDGGERGQAFRIGYQMAGENGNCQYFTFAQMVEWIGGADREAIVLNLAMQKPEISNRILESII